MRECPHCGGKSGVEAREWEEYLRFRGWDWPESEAECTGVAKTSKWRCRDCGHRFNVDPFAVTP